MTNGWNMARKILFMVGFILQITIVPSESGFVYDDHGKRDPLWPLVTAGGSIRYYDTDIGIGDMRLEGIMVGDENLAIINGKVVKVNDNIGGFRVIEIDEAHVKLDKEGTIYDLKLKKGE
jgi:hypothetical protein